MILLSNTAQFNQRTELWIFLVPCPNYVEPQKTVSYLKKAQYPLLFAKENPFFLLPLNPTYLQTFGPFRRNFCKGLSCAELQATYFIGLGLGGVGCFPSTYVCSFLQILQSKLAVTRFDWDR